MADIDALVAALTLEEKTALTAGEDFWSTVAVPRLGIHAIRLTDGPNGARGPGLGPSTGPSVCVPCGSALGATWDVALVERVGALLGKEARDRGCRVLLAPTLNLHRSPLAGRNFECYSEDPLLAGRLGAAFVRGVQSQSVIATVKHFVGNDAEFERGSISSVIDERTLREVYLLPFELAIREGGALALMTAYNRVNGRWVTEQPSLLSDLVRGEWGFRGLVMTDWFGLADTRASSAAGLDLEMPGPGRAFGPALLDAVRSGAVPERDVDAMVRRLFGALDRVGALDGATEAVAPEDRPEDRALAREAAVASTVLLRNRGVLPLDPAREGTIAVVGPNANAPTIMGGGSAQVTPHYLRTPLDALRDAFGVTADVLHERGCSIARAARPLGAPGLRCDDGFAVDVYDGATFAGSVISHSVRPSAQFLFFGPPEGARGDDWSLRLHGRVTVEESGRHRLTLTQCGRTRVFADDELVLDGETAPPPPGGEDFFGMGSAELVAEIDLVAGQQVEICVEYRPVGASFVYAAKVGFHPPAHDDLLERAVAAAARADVALVVVGTTDEWETETRDRASMRLPGRQDELVARVAASCPRTVVIVNAAAPVEMPWVDDVDAILWCWFGGQEMANAVADVLTGVSDPSGRLPTTIPLRLEHNPSYDNFPGENGEVRYGEGLFTGYRGYEHRCLPVRFPFGHGESYTTFELGPPSLTARRHVPGSATIVRVPVVNTGARRGSEVVQLYVEPPPGRLARPPKELKAFAKVCLDAGESTVVDLVLDDRAFAYWDPGQADWDDIAPRLGNLGGVTAGHERREPGWQLDDGSYTVHVGRSSTDITATLIVDVAGGEGP
jgi:beta-glucosidase